MQEVKTYMYGKGVYQYYYPWSLTRGHGSVFIAMTDVF